MRQTHLLHLLSRFSLLIIFTGLVALLTAGRALAQDTTPQAPDLTKLPDLLQWLSVGGSAVTAAALFSFLTEKLPAFAAWDNQIGKLSLQAGFSALLGLGSLAVLTLVPSETLAQVQPWFSGFMVSVLPVLGNFAWHQWVNQGPKAPSIQNQLQN